MRTSLAALGGIAALSLTLAAAPAATAPAIPMNGAQESGPGDNNGHGFFSYRLSGTDFCYSMSWRGIDTAVAAHVHVAPRNVAGPVVIPLDVGDGSGATVSDCLVIDAGLAAAIKANPKAYYVNVHNAAFPAGAIRGQLKRD